MRKQGLFHDHYEHYFCIQDYIKNTLASHPSQTNSNQGHSYQQDGIYFLTISPNT